MLSSNEIITMTNDFILDKTRCINNWVVTIVYCLSLATPFFHFVGDHQITSPHLLVYIPFIVIYYVVHVLMFYIVHVSNNRLVLWLYTMLWYVVDIGIYILGNHFQFFNPLTGFITRNVLFVKPQQFVMNIYTFCNGMLAIVLGVCIVVPFVAVVIAGLYFLVDTIVERYKPKDVENFLFPKTNMRSVHKKV